MRVNSQLNTYDASYQYLRQLQQRQAQAGAAQGKTSASPAAPSAAGIGNVASFLRLITAQRASGTLASNLVSSTPTPAPTSVKPGSSAATATVKNNDGDSVQLSDAAAKAVASKPATSTGSTTAPASTGSTAATSRSSAGAPDQIVALTQAFGQSKNDPGYNAASDLNGDGVINTYDLGALLSSQAGAQPSKPAPTTSDPVTQVTQAFGQTQGNPGYNASADINGDGVIDTRDLGAALSQPTQSSTASATPDPVTQVTQAFGQTQGSSGYNAAADINGDGVIDTRDLGAVLSQLGKK